MNRLNWRNHTFFYLRSATRPFNDVHFQFLLFCIFWILYIPVPDFWINLTRESILRLILNRLNANPLPIPYHRPRPVENIRLSNGNMVMIPPASPRKTVSSKHGTEKSNQQQQHQYKSTSSKNDISCEYVRRHATMG